MPSRRCSRYALAAALVALLGCAGQGRVVREAAVRGEVGVALRAYARLVESRGEGDPDLLADVAMATLERAATQDDIAVRAAGFSGLRSLGVRSRDVLERLARSPGPVGDRASAALYDLDGRRGDPPRRLREAARRGDTEGRVLGAVALRGRRGRRTLLAWTRDRDPIVRLTAAQYLGRLRDDADALEALATLSRDDADRGVRTVATSALGGHGAAALPALRAVLEGDDPPARMSAPGALMAAAPEEAEALLRPFLSMPVDAFVVESARALAGRGVAPAQTLLIEVMRRGRRELRAQAAVAAPMLLQSQAAALVECLELEEPEVVLRVAAALVRDPNHRDRARGAMRRLAMHPDGFVAVRATAALGALGEPGTLSALRRALASPEPGVRRVAVMAWSDALQGGADCDPLAPLLGDPDRSVALMAAVQIVLIAAR